MSSSKNPEIYYGPQEIRQGLTWREYTSEKARREKEARNSQYTDRWYSPKPKLDYIDVPFSTRLDWSQLVITAARHTGVRLRLLGIEGDTVVDDVRIDLENAQRVITQHIVAPNWVEYMATARNNEQYRSFHSEFEMEKDIRLIQGTLPIEPPLDGLGFGQSSRLGRLLSGNNRQGSYVD